MEPQRKDAIFNKEDTERLDMDKNSFFTEVNTAKSSWKITHSDRIFMIGSCFTDEIGGKLALHGFEVLKNPFGTIYNPLSIANLVVKSAKKEFFTPQDVIRSGEYYYLFAAHGDIRGKTVEDCLILANKTTEKVSEYLKNAAAVIVTLGTAWSYRYKEGDILMANCHKIPQKYIERRLLGISEVKAALCDMISAVGNINKDVKFIFTVSPVRHIKEGLFDNNVSKGVLLNALYGIINGGNNNAFYFPSYEIVIDELRDYRFYSRDLVHINDIAADYVWQKFSETYFDDETLALNDKYFKLFQMQNHKPFNPDSEGYKKHLQKIQQLEEYLKHYGK